MQHFGQAQCVMAQSPGDFIEGGFSDINGYEFLFSITGINFYNNTLVVRAAANLYEFTKKNDHEELGRVVIYRVIVLYDETP